MRQKISLLLGSGFSIPDGLPSVENINNRLSKIGKNEIRIRGNRMAYFAELNGFYEKLESFEERQFVEEFLNFYSSKILKANEKFHYETFIDFYSNHLNKINEDLIHGFYNDYVNKFLNGKDEYFDFSARMGYFDSTYIQLVAQLLHKAKYLEDEKIAVYPPYDSFINFIVKALISHDVKVHTLNHDLLFEYLGQNHIQLIQHFSDGYRLEGSKFFGFNPNCGIQNANKTITENQCIPLEFFDNKFDSSLCLYKLHGSIFNKVIYTNTTEHPFVRLKKHFGVSKYFRKNFDQKTGEEKLEPLHWDRVVPDFLSGTTRKMSHYNNDSHYQSLFNHFRINLRDSELLIVIGYGFQDIGINDYIREEYLLKGKNMVVISPKRPESSLLSKFNPQITFIDKGVTEIHDEEFLSLIPKNEILLGS